jgi:hypothetical protein
MSAAHSKDTYLATKFRRSASRRGPIKAIGAVEHAILIAIWHMLSNGVFYEAAAISTADATPTGPSSAPWSNSTSWATTSRSVRSARL